MGAIVAALTCALGITSLTIFTPQARAAVSLRGPGDIAGGTTGGPRQLPTFSGTGFFRTANSGGRWWLVTPDGHPFYSSGIDHVSNNPDTDQKTGQCPYCLTIAANYPSTTAWADDQVHRLRAWGFNTLGPFSDTSGTDGTVFTASMPYSLILDMASGNDWFSPAFTQHAQQVAQQQCAPLKNDPNLVGYYLDSELHWGPDWRENQPVMNDYLSLPDGSPGKAVAEQYSGNPDGFLTELATQYFKVTTQAIRAADPNHLILGVKAITQLTQTQLLMSAAPYVDVWSVDDYKLTPAFTLLIDALWPFYLEAPDLLGKIEAVIEKPVIVSEYSFRAADSGLTNSWPPIYPTYATQGQRAAQYQSYVDKLYADPNVVGDDWFEYVDEPYNGRFDGEDSNFGILSTADVPYDTMTTRMSIVHAQAPFIDHGKGPPCASWKATSTAGKGPKDVVCTAPYTVSSEIGPSVGSGFWAVDSGGGVHPYQAPDYGSYTGRLSASVIGIAATPDLQGYWLASADGGVFTFGNAGYFGSLVGRNLNAPIVSIAASPSGNGYWLVAADGGVFAFGDAGFFGSLSGRPLAGQVVGMSSAPDGNGYWIVAADGGIFTFGDAGYFGSAARSSPAPTVGMAPTLDGNGYWTVDQYGNVSAFGDAPQIVPSQCIPDPCRLVQVAPPVAGIVTATTGAGYWLASADGEVAAAGDALWWSNQVGPMTWPIAGITS